MIVDDYSARIYFNYIRCYQKINAYVYVGMAMDAKVAIALTNIELFSVSMLQSFSVHK